MKIYKKILCVIIIMLTILMMFSNNIYAALSAKEKAAMDKFDKTLNQIEMSNVIRSLKEWLGTPGNSGSKKWDSRNDLLNKYRTSLSQKNKDNPKTTVEIAKKNQIEELTADQLEEVIKSLKSGDLYNYYVQQQKAGTVQTSGSSSSSSSSFDSAAKGGLDDPITNPDAFDPSKSGSVSRTKFSTKAKSLIGVLQVVGVLVSIVSLMIIGIRYIFGSVEDKANYKETMVPYVIGAILVFAIPNILAIIYDLVSALKDV